MAGNIVKWWKHKILGGYKQFSGKQTSYGNDTKTNRFFFYSYLLLFLLTFLNTPKKKRRRKDFSGERRAKKFK